MLVSLLAQKAEVIFVKDATDEYDIKEFIKDLGFGASILENSAGENVIRVQVIAL